MTIVMYTNVCSLYVHKRMQKKITLKRWLNWLIISANPESCLPLFW